MRPDLLFDFIWRMIDTYSSEIFPGQHGKDTIQKCIVEVWIPMIKKDADLLKAINYLFLKIPVQSCEYLFKRLYEHFDGQEDIVKTQRHGETNIHTCDGRNFMTFVIGLRF